MANFQIGQAVEVFESDGQKFAVGEVCSVDGCAQSFNVRHEEVMLGFVRGFDLATGREILYTDGIQDDEKTKALGRVCRPT